MPCLGAKTLTYKIDLITWGDSIKGDASSIPVPHHPTVIHPKVCILKLLLFLALSSRPDPYNHEKAVLVKQAEKKMVASNRLCFALLLLSLHIVPADSSGNVGRQGRMFIHLCDQEAGSHKLKFTDVQHVKGKTCKLQNNLMGNTY